MRNTYHLKSAVSNRISKHWKMNNKLAYEPPIPYMQKSQHDIPLRLIQTISPLVLGSDDFGGRQTIQQFIPAILDKQRPSTKISVNGTPSPLPEK